MSRLFLWCVLAVWLLIAVAWAALQLWIVPRIGDFRPALETRASAALGVPVRIGRLTARPDGLIPAFELQDVSLLDPRGREALRLPLVLVSLTPRSLANAGFEQLYVDRPVLDVRRLANGRIEVAGLDFARPGESNTGAMDWFFSQREFVVQGGTVRWIDESPLTAAASGASPPPLALQRLDLVMRNSARSHALRLDATPPADWGARFTVAGRFRQPLLSLRSGDWQSWAGQLFADFSHVDISQLRRYANLGADVRAGRGALRVWADVAGGRVDGVTADLALAEVDAQLDPQLEPLGLQSVTGRLAARRLAGGFELSTQNLQFSTRDGLRWPGGNVLVASRAAQGGQPAGGEFRADALDLAALAQIANRLPLGTATHALLAGYAPRGRMEAVRLQWQGALGAIATFEAQGKLSQLELAAQRSALAGTGSTAVEPPGRPGLRGATVEFKATEAGGSARVQMAQGMLDLPGVFEDPQIPVDQLSADLQWKTSGQRLELTVPSLRLANADAQADLKLSWHTGDGPAGRFPGVLDLQGSLSRANGTRVHRYLPLAMPKLTRDYLREAIVAGTASGVKLRLRGDLRDFPFADPRRGEFQIAGQVSNATFAYAPRLPGRDLGNFPALQQLSGELVIDRNTLEVRNASGRIAGAPNLQITQAQARIPDLSHSTTVVVSADARGPLADMVGVVNGSALSGITGQALARATATGNAELKLRLNLPVMAIERSKVQGSVTLTGNDVQMSPAVPMLARARGVLGFNETGISQANVQARFLGGDLRVEGGARPVAAGPAVAAASFEPSAVFRAQGTVTADGLRQATEMGMVSRLAQSATGQAGYVAVLSLRRGVPEIAVSSSLQGMALGLPAPLAKTAEASLPLRFETSLLRDAAPAPAGAQKLQDQILLEVGRIASITYQRDISGAEPRVLRGAIAVGLAQGESAPLPDEGVVANINFARIDLDAWESLLSNASGVSIAQASAGRTRASDPALGYLPSVIAVRATELVLEGRKLNQVVVGGSRDGLTWRANLDARELNGYVEYRQPGGAGAGRLYARLARMEIGQSAQADIETTLDGQPGSVPALDIVVEDLELRGKRLGRVEIDAINRGAALAQREGGIREWRLNRLNINMPEGTLTASGNWAAVGADAASASAAGRRPTERRRTVMNFKLDVGDAGELLKRLGQPGVLRSGKGKLEGQVAWLGSPLALDYPSMGGQFNVNVENGQFLKADPGIAKLLGVLSLQSLPRRLALDFRDVFTEGFAFDFIRGDVHIDQGLAATNNLQMKGVNAGVLIEGKADIARETQDLKVTVVPEINAGTASLFTTFVNPAVGVGTFLAQLFLRRPLIQAATQEFHIDGSWADPKMARVERKPAPADGKPESKVETRNEVAVPAAQ